MDDVRKTYRDNMNGMIERYKAHPSDNNLRHLMSYLTAMPMLGAMEYTYPLDNDNVLLQWSPWMMGESDDEPESKTASGFVAVSDLFDPFSDEPFPPYNFMTESLVCGNAVTWNYMAETGTVPAIDPKTNEPVPADLDAFNCHAMEGIASGIKAGAIAFDDGPRAVLRIAEWQPMKWTV